MNEHEFTLHSANKYKDGSPIMSEPDTDSSYPFPKSNQLDPEFCEFGTCPYYDEKLKDHHERITINEGNIDAISSDVEDLQRKVAAIYQFLNSVAPGTFFEIMESLKKVEKENIHNGSDFCGNCTHCEKHSDDTVYICTLSHGFVDPDDSSCSHFEPPF